MLGFSFWGLGLRFFWAEGFRVLGLGFRVEGFRLKERTLLGALGVI